MLPIAGPGPSDSILFIIKYTIVIESLVMLIELVMDLCLGVKK